MHVIAWAKGPVGRLDIFISYIVTIYKKKHRIQFFFSFKFNSQNYTSLFYFNFSSLVIHITFYTTFLILFLSYFFLQFL